MKEEFCIMPDNPPLWRNVRQEGLHRHEVFGAYNRQKSIEDGLVIFLTPEMHNMSKHSIHQNKELDSNVKRMAQKVWQEYNGKDQLDFLERYGRNYL